MGAMTDTHFVNPIAEGADPTVVHDGDRYLWAQSEGNVGVAIWVSDRPTTLGTKHVVWWAPETGPSSKEVWAPELFRLDGRWYIYFAASDGNDDNHLTYVLESSGDDPLGDYTLHGPLRTGDSSAPDATPIWAIDMTTVDLGGERYAIWSGWPTAGKNQQDLYIAPLATPTRLGGDRVLLTRAGDYDWERIDDTARSKALAEGPQVLQRAGRTFIVYSCGGSWLPSYKLGMLELVGTDPLDPDSWRKLPQSVFQSNEATYGVGHADFTTSPNGREWLLVFHAKQDRERGWRRAVYVQPMRWRADGTPNLGQPVPAGAPVPVPAGGPATAIRDARRWDLTATGQEGLDYYGHHQYFAARPDGLHLGVIPAAPVNAYRSGEKVVVRDGVYSDFRAEVTFDVKDGSHDVGIIFRVTRAGVGFDAMRGYFAGVSTGRNTVVLGAMDGRGWREIAIAPVFLDPEETQRVSVVAVGSLLTVYVGSDQQPAISANDTTYARGSIGCRVVDAHAAFTSLTVTPQ